MNGKIATLPRPSAPPSLLTRRAAISVFVGAAAAGLNTPRCSHSNAAAAAVAPPLGNSAPPRLQQLQSVLRDEVDARSKDPARIAARTPPSPWTLIGTECTDWSETKLRRTYAAPGGGGKEDLVISYVWRPSYPPNAVSFYVTLIKGPTTVEFTCNTTESPLGGPFSITNSKTTTPISNGPFSLSETERVDFSSVPLAVQAGFYALLEERGIDRELCSYLEVLVARSDKEKKKDQEYATWLSKLQAYART